VIIASLVRPTFCDGSDVGEGEYANQHSARQRADRAAGRGEPLQDPCTVRAGGVLEELRRVRNRTAMLGLLLGALLASVSHATCPKGCSGHGTCGAADLCSCFPGFSDLDCSKRESSWVGRGGALQATVCVVQGAVLRGLRGEASPGVPPIWGSTPTGQRSAPWPGLATQPLECATACPGTSGLLASACRAPRGPMGLNARGTGGA
jgi:hypothetical protein